MNAFNRDRSRGQALVEFALVVPIFVLILVGILDLGRGVYAYNTLNNAAREGSRLAIVDQTVNDIQSFTAQQAGWLGVDPSQVTVEFRDPETQGACAGAPGSNAIVGCLAVVRVEYSYQAATPIISQLVGTISLVGESQFRVEANCAEPVKPTCPAEG